jgi:hypothetical protein
MAHLFVNIEEIYKTYFQDPYQVKGDVSADELVEYGRLKDKADVNKSIKGIDLSRFDGSREIFLPVSLWMSEQEYLTIDCCTIRVTSKKTIIRTAVSERVGTIKEQFSIGDYIFSVKGVLIGANRQFPDEQILKLKQLYETTEPVELHNALAELFMTDSRRIAIESIEFPETKGGSKHHRPFTMTCESDFVNELEIMNEN